MNTAPARVGMFGGAFDPPHVAHVALARAAVAQLQLDVLHVVPTGQAWHKARRLSPAPHRLAMARLAFGGLEHVRIDDRELLRPGPTYTVDTLRELRAEYPGATLYLLMGEDQAGSFGKWQAWPSIAQLATLAVAQRHGPDAGGLQALQAMPGVQVRALALPAMPQSATEIRHMLTIGQDITQLVPAGIAGYIENNNLYQTT